MEGGGLDINLIPSPPPPASSLPPSSASSPSSSSVSAKNSKFFFSSTTNNDNDNDNDDDNNKEDEKRIRSSTSKLIVNNNNPSSISTTTTSSSTSKTKVFRLLGSAIRGSQTRKNDEEGEDEEDEDEDAEDVVAQVNSQWKRKNSRQQGGKEGENSSSDDDDDDDDYEDEFNATADASFVLNYSTVSGTRIKQDPILQSFFQKSLRKNFVRDFLLSNSYFQKIFGGDEDKSNNNNKLKKKKLKRAAHFCSKMLLLLYFLIPLIWVLIISCVFDPMTIPQDLLPTELPLSSSSGNCKFISSSVITTFFNVSSTTLSKINQQQSKLVNLSAPTSSSSSSSSSSSPFSFADCIVCNNNQPRISLLSSSSLFSVSSVANWNPYVFAVFFIFSFWFLCLVLYHRYELRKRVAVHFLSFGCCCSDRMTKKKKIGIWIFFLFFFVTCIAIISPQLAQALVLSAEDGGNLKLRSAETVTRKELGDLIFLENFTGEIEKKNMTKCFAISSSSSSSISASSSSELLFDLKVHGLVFNLEQDYLFQTFISPSVSQSVSFLRFFQLLFAAMFPWLMLLIPLYSRTLRDQLVVPLLDEASFLPHHQHHGQNNNSSKKKKQKQQAQSLEMMNYVSQKLLFVTSIDVALKAISLLSVRSNRLSNLGDFSRRSNNNNNKNKNLLFHQDDDDDEEDDDGENDDDESLFLWWPLAMTWYSGYTKLFSGGGGRFTSTPHPHELLFGMSWAIDDEEAMNSVLSILNEHHFLSPLHNNNDDDQEQQHQKKKKEQQQQQQQSVQEQTSSSTNFTTAVSAAVADFQL